MSKLRNLSLSFLVATVLTAAKSDEDKVEYLGNNHCGQVPISQLNGQTNIYTPETRLTTSDGLKYRANGDGIWKIINDQTVDQTEEYQEKEVFTIPQEEQSHYACVDLRRIDISEDGTKELLFVTPKNLYVLNNNGELLSKYPVNLSVKHTVKISTEAAYAGDDNNLTHTINIVSGNGKSKIIRNIKIKE